MDKNFNDAVKWYWTKRFDSLSLEAREHTKEFSKLMEEFGNKCFGEQKQMFWELESCLGLKEAALAEFYYSKGFKDAVNFLYGIIKKGEGIDDCK